MKKYYEKNKEQIKQTTHNLYEKNKEHHYEKMSEWRKNNKKHFCELVMKSKRRKVEKLRDQGIKNPWEVVNYGKEPRYIKEGV